MIFWNGTWDQFLEFFDYMNGCHHTIKFDIPCYNAEDNSCNFLDLKISIKDGVIRTDLYRKPTDKPRALLPSSAHPTHITQNIIYSMAFRLLRICDNEDTFEERLSELKTHFLIPRNYSSKLIDLQFQKVRNLPGNNFTDRHKLALVKRQKVQKSDRVIGFFNYNPLLPKISTVLSKHHRTMINENPELSEVFPEPPMAVLRQGPNLRRLLCKAKLTKVTRNRPRAAHRSSAGWKRCSSSGGNPCNQCPFTPVSALSITSHITGYTHNITSAINCKTKNIVYAYKCKKCPSNFNINTSKRIHKMPVQRGIVATNYIGKSISFYYYHPVVLGNSN